MAEVSPRSKPHGTPFTWEIRKPHPGLIQFCVVFPDGDHWVWRQVELHDAEKVASNTGALAALPSGWEVLTAEERQSRAGLRQAIERSSGPVRDNLIAEYESRFGGLPDGIKSPPDAS